MCSAGGEDGLGEVFNVEVVMEAVRVTNEYVMLYWWMELEVAKNTHVRTGLLIV